MTFEEALKQVPDDWTAWQLRTRQRKTRFVFTMTRLDDFSEDETESDPGHGATPTEAVLAAIAKLSS